MRTGLIASSVLTLLFVSVLAYGDDIKTLDGKTYYNVQVISKTPTALTVECTKLPVSEDRVLKMLKLSRLDESTQKKYGYSNATADQSKHKDQVTTDNPNIKQNAIPDSKSSTAFDVQQGASGQQYLIQKTKLSKIQDSINARTAAQVKEMDDNAN